jgi:hypothetical protein
VSDDQYSLLSLAWHTMELSERHKILYAGKNKSRANIYKWIMYAGILSFLPNKCKKITPTEKANTARRTRRGVYMQP